MPKDAVGLQSPNEIDIFHERKVGKPAHFVEHGAAHEEALIAIRQTQPTDTPADAALEDPRLPCGRVQTKREAAADHSIDRIDFAKRGVPVQRQHAVGVDEPQPPATRTRSALIQLKAAGASAVKPPDVGTSVPDLARIGIQRSLERDDHFDLVARNELRDETGNAGSPGRAGTMIETSMAADA